MTTLLEAVERESNGIGPRPIPTDTDRPYRPPTRHAARRRQALLA